MKKALAMAALAALTTNAMADPNCGTPSCSSTKKVAAPAATPQAADTWAFLPAVVATVDGQDVKKEEVIQAVTAATRQFAQQGMSLSQLPKQFLDQYVGRAINSRVERLLLLARAKADGVIPAEELATKAIEVFGKQIDQQKAMFAKMPKEQREQIAAQIKQARGMTIDEAIESQRKQMSEDIKKRATDVDYQKTLAVQVWVDSAITSTISVDDSEASDFFDKNQKRFTQPETVTASHILITPEGADPRAGKKATPEATEAAKKKIEGILKQINDGADFGELATKESACPSGKSNKGSLGAFPKGQMDPAFEKAAFGLEKGAMSGVVESSFGFHLIKVTDKAEGKVAKLDDVRESIKDQLKGQKVNEKVQAAIKEQREKSDVVVNYEAPAAPAMPGMPGMPQQ